MDARIIVTRCTRIVIDDKHFIEPFMIREIPLETIVRNLCVLWGEGKWTLSLVKRPMSKPNWRFEPMIYHFRSLSGRMPGLEFSE